MIFDYEASGVWKKIEIKHNFIIADIIIPPELKNEKDFAKKALLGSTVKEGIFKNIHKFKCVTCFRSKMTKPFYQGKLPTDGAVGK